MPPRRREYRQLSAADREFTGVPVAECDRDASCIGTLGIAGSRSGRREVLSGKCERSPKRVILGAA